MATGSSGASEIENEQTLHAQLQVNLARMLVDGEVQELKYALQTAGILAPRQVENCKNFYNVWDSLKKVGRLGVGDYDELKKWMGILHHIDCVRVIDDYKRKIDDCRTGQKGLEQQLEELTIDGAGEPQLPADNIDFSGAEKTDKKQHAHLLTVLDRKLKDEEVQRLKHLLGTSKTIPLDILAKCNNFYDVWNSLEGAQKLAIGEYDELCEWMEMLKRKDCVDVINHYKGKIEDYRERHQKGGSLVTAAQDGDATEVRKLLSEGTDVDYGRISDGWTALMLASYDGHLVVVDALLNGGAEVNKEEKDGTTAFIVAAENGHLDVVDALLKGGAEINKGMEDGGTPLMFASKNGHRDVVDALLKGGAEVDEEAEDGATALFVASQEGHLDVVDALLKGEADVNKEMKDGTSALEIASQNGHLDVVDVLLKKGAAIDKTDKNGFTAFMIASQNGHLDVADVLLKNGAAIDKTNKDGCTALMKASQHGHLDVVDALLKKGAATVKTCKNGRWTALKLAEDDGYKEVVELLKKSGAKR